MGKLTCAWRTDEDYAELLCGLAGGFAELALLESF